MAKISIKEAIAKSALNKFDLNFPHITTQGFGMATPTLCTEILPRDRFKISFGYQTLLAPLSTPAFCDINSVTRFFFVPMDSIYPYFKHMYEDSGDVSVSTNMSVPTITNADIVGYFINSPSMATRVVGDLNLYYRTFDGDPNKYIVDNLGRLVIVDRSQQATWHNVSRWCMFVDSAGVLQVRPADSYINKLGWDIAVELNDGTDKYRFFYAYNGALQTPYEEGIVFVGKNASATRGDYTNVNFFSGDHLKTFNSQYGSSFDDVNANWQDTGAYSTADLAEVNPGDYFTYEVQINGSHAYDFVVSSTQFKFTYLGRYLMKVLHGLGYNVNWSLMDTTEMSALPIVAYLRVWFDFLYPSQYVETLGWASFFHDCHGSLGDVPLDMLVQVLILPYRQDYYTAAWKQFMSVGYNSNSFPYTNAFAPNDGSTRVATVRNVPAIQKDSTSSEFSFTQYGLKVLSGITDWAIRNNVAGSRFFEQMEARFGVKDYNVDPTRSMYIDSVSTKVQIGDTLASTETDSQLLGERAGVGSGRGGDNIHFENRVNQFGYLIAVSMIMPNIDYYQGRDRQLQHKTKFDFFMPEFERTWMQAIRNDELFADYIKDSDFTAGANYGGAPNNVFGFAPRYSEYKHGRGVISGDFRFASRNLGLDAYHAMRKITPPSQTNPLALGMNFMCVDDQYSRLFAQLKDQYNEPIDHFVSLFNFNIEAYRPMQTISEQVMIEEGGELVTVDNEGTQL